MFSSSNIEEAKQVIENAKAAQDQYFDSLIRLIERLEIEIEMLRSENAQKSQ